MSKLKNLDEFSNITESNKKIGVSGDLEVWKTANGFIIRHSEDDEKGFIKMSKAEFQAISKLIK